jgi:hypothetical protein
MRLHLLVTEIHALAITGLGCCGQVAVAGTEEERVPSPACTHCLCKKANGAEPLTRCTKDQAVF